MNGLWEWLKENWFFTVVLVPIAVDAAKRLTKDWDDQRKQRRGIEVDLSGGILLFEELQADIRPSLAKIDAYQSTGSADWLERAERLFRDIVSGLVIDECYLDPKTILLTLTFEEARACSIAVETWRRIRMHEVAYRAANDKLLAELARLRSLDSATAPKEETPVVAELVTRLGDELRRIDRLILDYGNQVRAAIAVLHGELGSVDASEARKAESSMGLPRIERVDSSKPEQHADRTKLQL